MKICIIAEGSYPYITGGVSNWTQMLIKSLPEHDFIIYTIGAKETDAGKYKYKLPQNVIDIKENFLSSISNEKSKAIKNAYINRNVKRALIGLMNGDCPDWGTLFRFINKAEYGIQEFLNSRDFLNLVFAVNEKNYRHIAFNHFYWTMKSMLLPLLKIIRNGVPRADIYHCISTGYAGVIASMGKIIYNSPCVLTEHGIYTREREEEIIKSDWIQGYLKTLWINYFHNLSRCVYNYSDTVISLFERNRQIQIELGCARGKTKVIPNGINCDEFKILSPSPMHISTINIGAILRIVPIKDVITLIQGFSVANEKINNLKLFIMGPFDEDTDYYYECISLAESLGLKNVAFTGQVNIKKYISDMDILILSSISEGQPLSVLEGMAAGKPHILTDVGCCRELIYGEGDNFGAAGIIVPIMDYKSIGQAIINLCKNRETRIRMGQNALSRVSKLYTLTNFIDNYRSVYKEMISKNGGDRF